MLRWKLKEVVDERGLHLRDIATISGVSYKTVSKVYHNTTKHCRLSTIEKIANALDIRCETLMESSEETDL